MTAQEMWRKAVKDFADGNAQMSAMGFAPLELEEAIIQTIADNAIKREADPRQVFVAVCDVLGMLLASLAEDKDKYDRNLELAQRHVKMFADLWRAECQKGGAV